MGDKSLVVSSGVFDRSNPRGLWSIVWDELRDRLGEIESSHGVDLAKSEGELKKEFSPGVLENRIRLRFWEEYQYVQDNDLEKMRLKNILRGICREHVWVERIVKVPWALIWVICPPIDYVTSMREILYYGLEELREVMVRPFVEKKYEENKWVEKVNLGLIDRKMEIFKLLDQRIHGAIVQRVAIQQQIDNRVTVGSQARLTDISVLDAEIDRVKKNIEGIVSRDVLKLGERIGEVVEDARENSGNIKTS